jgi:hypothetical protein
MRQEFAKNSRGSPDFLLYISKAKYILKLFVKFTENCRLTYLKSMLI